MTNLKEYYLLNVVPKLLTKFSYSNIHQIPKIEKIHLNAGIGLNSQNRVFLQKTIDEIRLITGQHPILTYSKVSIAGFKIRKGMPLGVTVTLRREKMYDFLDKLIKLVFPRIRDFRGLKKTNFDKDGNFNFGISDQLIFPEIDYDIVEQQRGFNITIVTSTKDVEQSFFLLNELGMPFKK